MDVNSIKTLLNFNCRVGDKKLASEIIRNIKTTKNFEKLQEKFNNPKRINKTKCKYLINLFVNKFISI